MENGNRKEILDQITKAHLQFQEEMSNLQSHHMELSDTFRKIKALYEKTINNLECKLRECR